MAQPPYDHDDEVFRQEHKFLLHCTRYLAPGGLFSVVPQGWLKELALSEANGSR